MKLKEIRHQLLSESRISDFISKKLKEEGINNKVELTYLGGTNGHTFIKIGNKFYDSESPNGVSHFNKLNWFKRIIIPKHYKDFLKEKWIFDTSYDQYVIEP